MQPRRGESLDTQGKRCSIRGSTVNLDAAGPGRFLGRLAEKHADPGIVFSLRLAETGLDALEHGLPAVPAVAVVGPTQTGKSTVVNVLAGGEYVDASPLAAHTRHTAVLALNAGEEPVFRSPSLVRSLRLEPRLCETDAPPCTIWDTPDFDSNASATYRQQVARVCALVDLVVIVLSKEKYADQSVWSVLETIAPLRTPTIVCLNKCDAGPGGSSTDDGSDAGLLLPVIRRRLRDNPSVDPDIPVAALPMVPRGELAALLRHEDVRAFREAVFERLRFLPAAARRDGLGRLVEANWDAWTAPVHEELACHDEWSRLLADRTRAFMDRYRAEYIDHAGHHDVARKAMLGLLELLEIPSLAQPMARVRRMLTWPVHKLAAAFGRTGEAPPDQELEVVRAAFDHYLLSLRGEVLDHRHPWWRALEGELAEREPELRRDFAAAVDRYREAFQPRIDRLSEELYGQLQENPVTLNALRAARVSADAGGVLLAVKTGTLGLYDALFAPAVISLTSYLTESAVGQYLKTVIGRLKREQVEQVGAIIHDNVESTLRVLQPGGPGLFGVTRGELERAREQLGELRG